MLRLSLIIGIEPARWIKVEVRMAGAALARACSAGRIAPPPSGVRHPSTDGSSSGQTEEPRRWRALLELARVTEAAAMAAARGSYQRHAVNDAGGGDARNCVGRLGRHHGPDEHAGLVVSGGRGFHVDDQAAIDGAAEGGETLRRVGQVLWLSAARDGGVTAAPPPYFRRS